MKILVVEDEADVRDLMVIHLKREGHEVEWTDNGEDAVIEVQKKSFHLLVLDWMLPGVSGLDVCRKVSSQLPVLMVTARADAADIVLGLEVGAEDYITKPFELPVFLARVRAILRRSQAPAVQVSDCIQIGQLVLHVQKHEVTCAGQSIQLTASEFKLLEALMSFQGRVLSREKLIELVQGQGVVVIDRAIDTHIFGLRKKLGPCADVIETIRGVGYRIKSSELGA